MRRPDGRARGRGKGGAPPARHRTQALSRAALRAAALEARPRFEKLLRAFVAVPSVSSDRARHRDLLRMGDLAASTLRDAGAAVRMMRTRGGRPLIVGDFVRGAGLPTVTLYNHLDVQPAAGAGEGWRTDPFRLTPRGGRYFGRGATDDKGPALASLLGLLAAREADVPVNVRVLWETEEEIGSPGLEEILRRARARLRTDCIVVSDTVWISPSIPASPAGLRGFQGFRFRLRTGGSDRHSGDVGGAARNPLSELMDLMARLHDARSGRVRVPGFYDDVVRPTRRELADFVRSGFRVGTFRRNEQLRLMRAEDPREILKRIWAWPTFEVHGASGGHPGPGLKAIVPGRAEVMASCRLVPRQDPWRVFSLIRDFTRSIHPDVEVLPAGSAAPFRGATEGAEAEALRGAVRFAFGREPVFVRDGGSIGAASSLRDVLRAPLLFLGLSLPADGYHAPNESFAWKQAAGGIVAFASLLDRLSGLPRLARSPRERRPVGRRLSPSAA